MSALEQEMDKGKIAAIDLCIHLLRMNAAGLEIPVEANGLNFKVTVTRVADASQTDAKGEE
jgi:hypothetical protein